MKLACSLVLLTLAAGVVCAAQEPPSDPTDRCVMGGFRPGSPAPNVKDKKQFVRRDPSVFAPIAGKSYFATSGGVFLDVAGTTIAHVVREWEGDAGAEVYDALVKKYGEPSVPAPLVPSVSSNYHPFGGTVRMEYRWVWKDDDCGQRIVLIKQSKTSITAFAGGSADHYAVVMSAAPPADSADPLK